MNKVITITTNTGWVATYHGGAYIDVSHKSNPDVAIDAINVWDYATDTPTIPFTDDAIIAAVDEWEAEYGADYLANVVAFGTNN